MQHFIKGENIGLIYKLGHPEVNSAPAFVTNSINDFRSWSRPGMQGGDYSAPLYLYLKDGSRVPNLKQEIVDSIQNVVGKVSPEDIFDYIYAVLHSPTYRKRYKEFLKIDFPRVPYPKDKKIFKNLVKIGSELRKLHLMESPKLERFITTYPEAGTDTVEKIEYKDNKVFINHNQYFGKVPKVAWDFYIGGYQPARKWLKDRIGKTLTNENLEHYQKIIVALVETDRLMKKIDEIVPKWPMK
jgi:predicted helicase